MSKLTWVHFAGAGAAVLVVLGVIVGLGVIVLTSGSKKGKEPVKPAALTEESSKPAPQPTDQPSQQQATQPTQPTTPPGGADQTTVVPGSGSNGTAVIPIQQPPAGSTTSATASDAPSRPAQKAPAQSRPKAADSGDAARKRRDAALKALDQ
jgi:cytoskeletal protein RodZ